MECPRFGAGLRIRDSLAGDRIAVMAVKLNSAPVAGPYM